MDNICRICLVDGSNRDVKTLTKEILLKVSSCFGNDIIVTNILPQTICQFCWDKIEDIHTFRQKIIENQNVLLKLSKISDCNINDNDRHDELGVKEELKLENKENEIIQENDLKLELREKHFEIVSPRKYELSDSEEKFDSGDENVSLSAIKRLKEKVAVNNENEMGLKPYTNREIDGQIETCMNFPCLTCFKVSKTQNELVKHYNEEHKIHDKLDKEQMQKENKYDAIIIDGCSQYKCNNCGKVFDTKRKISRHTRSHVEDRPFLCKLCGRTYKTVSEIVRHGRAHNGTKVPCRYRCGYSTGYLGALKEHEKRHRTEYMYTCEKCSKGFQVLTWYEQHQNIHTGLKPFVCEICGLAFHMDRYLKAHLTTVHPQESNRKRFVCVHCSKPCDSKKSLTLHLKEHGITTKFLCDICGKVMSDGSQLSLHKRMHLNNKPFSCNECGKSFARRSHLTLHSRTHSSQKAYECSHCERTYAQRATLRRHMRRFHMGNVELVNNET